MTGRDAPCSLCRAGAEAAVAGRLAIVATTVPRRLALTHAGAGVAARAAHRIVLAGILVVALMVMAGPATAQERTAADGAGPDGAGEPRLTMDLPETEAIPGQALSLRLTVLVPTHMPKPPVWPSFEAPNLWVRVASTGPTSERVDGETWAGVTRRYLLAPMVPGEIVLPRSELIVTYADPQSNEPRRARLAVEPIRLAGVAPAGAEQLDPFLAAQSFALEQSVVGETKAMTPGASVTRTVTANIGGTSPMFVPPLLAPATVEGVRLYPGEPVVQEKSERGQISGTRTESVTLVAEGGGEGTLPAVSLEWYNLRTGKVERATVDEVAVTVTGPKAGDDAPRDWRIVALWGLVGLLAAALAVLAVRRAWPPARRYLAARRAARLASEGHAFAQLRRAVNRRDHPGLRPALDRWRSAAGTGDAPPQPHLEALLTTLGRARYGTAPGGEDAAWAALSEALPALRREAHAHTGRRPPLPPLNPTGPPKGPATSTA